MPFRAGASGRAEEFGRVGALGKSWREACADEVIERSTEAAVVKRALMLSALSSAFARRLSECCVWGPLVSNPVNDGKDPFASA